MSDLTAYAIEGFSAELGAKSPYLASSDMDSAWRIGEWMALQHLNPPFGVRASRGMNYHVSGRIVRVDWKKGQVTLSWKTR